MDKVDVLIPHCNDSAGFLRSLKSIEAQDWNGRFRVVVVDDASRKEEADAVASALEESPVESVYLVNEENRGRPYTRNRLLDCMESPYVAWLDAGDEWFPSKTREQLRVAKDTTAPRALEQFWVTCSYQWVQSNLPERQYRQNIEGDPVKNLLLGGKFRAYLWTLLAPRSAMASVGWFDERLPRLQDLDFFIRFAMKGGIFVSPDPTVSLCAYFKEHQGRNAVEVMKCQDYLYEKYAYLYHGYGELFAMRCEYAAVKNAMRFARANGDEALRSRFKMRARKIKMQRMRASIQAILLGQYEPRPKPSYFLTEGQGSWR